MDIDEGGGAVTDWKHGGQLKNFNLDKVDGKELTYLFEFSHSAFAF